MREPFEPRLALHRATADLLVLHLRAAGELDCASIPALCDLTVHALAHGSRHLRLDLADITACDNAALYTLLGIRHALEHADGSLQITAASPAVCAGIHRTGLEGLLPLTPP